MRTTVLMIGAVLAIGQPQMAHLAYSKPALGPGTVVPAGAEPELLWEGGTWLEGPAVAPSGEVYFSDIIEVRKSGKLGVIRVYDAQTQQVRLYRSPSHGSNGLLFDANGMLLAAHGAAFGGRFITRTDLTTNLSEVVAGIYNGRSFNSPNDIALDIKGRIYFTDPRYGGHEPLEQPVMGVYRVDPDGTVHLLIANIVRPNGIAVSADNARLYVAEMNPPNNDSVPAVAGSVQVLRFDLSADGTVSNRRTVIAYDSHKVAVDGIKTDREGNLYITEMADTPGIRVLDPEGNPKAFIATPESPVNLTFARVGDQNWLYFTTATRLYRIKALIPGG